MALVPDATSFGGSTTNPNSSLTVAHTVAAGATLLVFIINTAGATTDTATWNGSSMTLWNSQTFSGETQKIFYIVNPASGTHNVVITCSGNNLLTGHGISFLGSDTTTPLANFFASNGTGTTGSTAVTTSKNNSFIVSSLLQNTAAASTNTTTDGSTGWGLTATASNGGTIFFHSGSSSIQKATSGSYTSSWSFTGGTQVWGVVAFEVNQAVAAANGNFLKFM